MESLESVRTAVQSWRVTHPRRGRRFPAELKQRVASLVGSIEVGVLSRELRVSVDQLQRWRALYSPSASLEQAGQSVPCSPFIEVPLSLGAGPGATEVELEVGGVSRLRLRGELSAAMVRGIVEVVCQAQAGGCS